MVLWANICGETFCASDEVLRSNVRFPEKKIEWSWPLSNACSMVRTCFSL